MKKISEFIKLVWKIIYKLIILSIILLMVFAIIQKTTDNRGSIGGIKVFTVITGSMIPVYNIGDILIVQEVNAEELKVGDDIVYKGENGSFQNKTVTHRIISIKQKEDGNYGIVTKGVANLGQDPEINQTQVFGKVIGKIPIINYILKIVFNIYTWMFIPVVILIYKNIKKIINYDNE